MVVFLSMNCESGKVKLPLGSFSLYLICLANNSCAKTAGSGICHDASYLVFNQDVSALDPGGQFPIISKGGNNWMIGPWQF